MLPEAIIEAAREHFPELVEEYERLKLWAGTCIGTDIATWGGPKVNE